LTLPEGVTTTVGVGPCRPPLPSPAVPWRPGAVCISCLHFRHAVGRGGVTLLTCPIQPELIAQGEHFTKGCVHWSPQQPPKER
jgi:hypothetical protein